MFSDGIAGFKVSLECVFPRTPSQRRVIHLVRTINYNNINFSMKIFGKKCKNLH